MSRYSTVVGPELIKAPLENVVRVAIADPKRVRKLLRRHPEGPIVIRSTQRKVGVRAAAYGSFTTILSFEKVPAGTLMSLQTKARIVGLRPSFRTTYTPPNPDQFKESARQLETKALALDG
jgi:hypothetical protein